MRICALVTLGIYAGFGAIGFATDEGPQHLPTWTEDGWQAHMNAADPSRRLGGLLWPDGAEAFYVLPQLREGSSADSPDLAQPPADLTGFLPPSLIRASEPRVARMSTPADLQDLSADAVTAAYDSSPDTLFIDPTYQLTAHERDDMERFLSFHDRDAMITAYVLLIGQHEKLPADFEAAKLVQGGLLKENRCLLVVPHGDPQRARLFFTSNLHRDTAPVQLSGILADCVAHGASASDPQEQLHRLLVRLSIRLFWLENVLRPATKLTEVPIRSVVAADLPKTQETKPQVTLTPSVMPTTVTEVSAPLLVSDAAIRDTAVQPVEWLALFGLLTALGGFALFRWRRYKMRHYEWYLPDIPTANPRLGGLSSGGAGAWINFGRGQSI
ncbi:MAG: hypothetical protein JNJ83_15775 [Verrucomicrobiaceae bacterium]|nr:hypothetical protein [Verrucomicrobiaceae bacterium]